MDEQVCEYRENLNQGPQESITNIRKNEVWIKWFLWVWREKPNSRQQCPSTLYVLFIKVVTWNYIVLDLHGISELGKYNILFRSRILIRASTTFELFLFFKILCESSAYIYLNILTRYYDCYMFIATMRWSCTQLN